MDDKSDDTTPELNHIVSQKDYVPTPYRQSNWEGLDQIERNPTFKAINVNVVPNQNLKIDPMFERFDIGFKPSTNASSDSEQLIKDEPEVISEELLEEIRNEAFEQGRLAGIEEGRMEAQEVAVARYEELAVTIQEITSAINLEVFNRLKEMEEKALGLSLDVAKRLVETTVDAKPEYILSVIRTALKNIGAAKPLIVKVSNQDYEFLQVVGLPEDLTNDGVKIQYLPDEKVLSGCIVETDHGQINLELDSMWNEIKNKLFVSCKG